MGRTFNKMGLPILSKLSTQQSTCNVYSSIPLVIFILYSPTMWWRNYEDDWQGGRQLLFWTAKVLLIQTTTSSIPSYTMQTNKLPLAITEELDRTNRKFFWETRLIFLFPCIPPQRNLWCYLYLFTDSGSNGHIMRVIVKSR